MNLGTVPIDCEWGTWEIGTCTSSNGGCIRTNTRTKTSKESNGGQCNGKQETVQEDCNADDCIGNL